jgi:hypothetical protein
MSNKTIKYNCNQNICNCETLCICKFCDECYKILISKCNNDLEILDKIINYQIKQIQIKKLKN